MSSSSLSILFFGTPQFASEILHALIDSRVCSVKGVVTGEDKASGRGNRTTPSPVKELALAHKIPVFQPSSIKKNISGFLACLEAAGPFDLGVVAAFGLLLPVEVLSNPVHGCINVHASLLPRWRGAAPVQRAVMEGDGETGVCIMQVTEGLDSGPVFSRQSLPILPDDDSGTLFQKLSKIGSELLVDAIPRICTGELQPEPQPEDGVTYAHKLRKEEELIDWNEAAGKIHDKIRALAPSPGAYTFLKQRRLKILKASCVDTADVCAEPGEIITLDRGRLEISCGSGILSLLDLQPEGKRRMTIRDFLAGANLRMGEKLQCPGNAGF